MQDKPLIREIATTILDAVGIDNIDIETITAETSLGENGIGLDSIDILEAVAAIEDAYKVKIVDAIEGAKYFKSFGTIEDFVQSNRK